MNKFDDIKIVLASSSPSRKLLLERAEIDFTVVVSGVDEDTPASFSPKQTVECLAERKADAVLDQCGDSVVIASDSMVSFDDLIIGKPADLEDAKKTLHMLSGQTHKVYTGVCIAYRGKKEVFSQFTDVLFYDLTDEEIDEYTESGESFGRAGSYGIEGKGVTLIKSINGDYSNIVGLPVAETLRKIKAIIE